MSETKCVETSQVERIVKPCYMVATKAIHQLGDISRDEPDFCRVTEKCEGGYKGMWCEGYGFFNVFFPEETTRPVTKEEQEKIDSMRLVIV